MKIPKYIYILLCLSLALVTCSDNAENLEEEPITGQEAKSFEEQIMAVPNNTFENTELVTAYSEVMKQVLTMAQDGDFRSFVFENVQIANINDEDYVMELGSMTKKLKSSSKFAKSSAKLESMVSKINTLSPYESPMVFYPKAETIEDNLLAKKGYNVAKNLKEPIAVLKGAYNNDYSAPGYKLNSKGELVYDRDVTEDYAWENDVYVIGEAEKMSRGTILCENMQKSGGCYSGGGGTGGGGTGGGGSPSKDIRTDGRAENGGAIQVIALNEIEHWTAGKLELRLVVTGLKDASGTVIRDIKFPKVKRKKFKDKKWYDYNAFLFNYNLSVFGDFTIEKWIERDNGWFSAELSVSIPGSAYKPATSTTPAQPAYPGGTVKINIKSGDEDLGTSIVQFSDKISQVYNLGQANFKRN